MTLTHTQQDFTDRHFDETVRVLSAMREQELHELAINDAKIARDIAEEICGEDGLAIVQAIASGDGNQALAVLKVAYVKALKKEAEYWALNSAEAVCKNEYEELAS